MARAQDLSLMPGAVNGQCGRMKCCLRYEVAQYEDAADGMPPTGYLVSWPGGEGVVVARDILARKVTVKADGRFLTLAVSELNPRTVAASPAADAGGEELDENGGLHDEDPDT
jgi:cell fate regulator YaaT (PSP1 superfamily)